MRLPKKLGGTGPHRGFAFVDFLTKQDAKVRVLSSHKVLSLMAVNLLSSIPKKKKIF